MSPDGSQCVCKPGWYPLGPDCVPCDAGYMCPNGTRVQCPKHYYQPATQATSCLRCATTGDGDGFFRCNRNGHQLQYCDPDVRNTQDRDLFALCVPCQQCRRYYATTNTDPNLLWCYRDA